MEKPSFFALNPDGTEKWQSFKTSNSIISSAAIGADGTVYVGSYGGVLYAFGETDGAGVSEETVWEAELDPDYVPENVTVIDEEITHNITVTTKKVSFFDMIGSAIANFFDSIFSALK